MFEVLTLEAREGPGHEEQLILMGLLNVECCVTDIPGPLRGTLIRWDLQTHV